MADVVVFFRKMFTPNLIIIKMFFFKQIDFLKKTPSLKNLKKFIVIARSITKILGI